MISPSLWNGQDQMELEQFWIIFKSKGKQITKYLSFPIGDQITNISNKVEYLGIKTEKEVDWNVHIKDLILKSKRVTDILSIDTCNQILIKDNLFLTL